MVLYSSAERSKFENCTQMQTEQDFLCTSCCKLTLLWIVHVIKGTKILLRRKFENSHQSVWFPKGKRSKSCHNFSFLNIFCSPSDDSLLNTFLSHFNPQYISIKKYISGFTISFIWYKYISFSTINAVLHKMDFFLNRKIIWATTSDHAHPISRIY